MSAPTITDKQLRAIVAAGGECRADKGLYLSAKGRSPTWFLRYTSPEGGRRREMTIGPYPDVGLAAAREEAAELRAQIRSGVDPIEHLLRYLAGLGYVLPDAVDPAAARQAMLVRVYREGGFAAQVCERFVDLDEGLQEWRYRHVNMVERTIGVKPGTGGSSGAGYLRETLFKPLFPDLWAIRAQL